MIRLNEFVLPIKHFPAGTLMMLGLEEILLNCGYCKETGFKDSIELSWYYENNEEQIYLYNIVHHLRSLDRNVKIYLFMPYVPNAQMDRVKSFGEVFTLKYFCSFINDLNFEKVVVVDVHSDATLALLDRVIHNTAKESVLRTINRIQSDLPLILFYPDNGAAKKYSEYFEGAYLYAVKNRNWATGEILGLEVIGEVPAEPFNVLFVDDIIAYGGTCYYSAKKLKELGANKIYAYISHVEDSILDEEKGTLIKSGLLEKIYCTNSIFTKEHPLIEKV